MGLCWVVCLLYEVNQAFSSFRNLIFFQIKLKFEQSDFLLDSGGNQSARTVLVLNTILTCDLFTLTVLPPNTQTATEFDEVTLECLLKAQQTELPRKTGKWTGIIILTVDRANQRSVDSHSRGLSSIFCFRTADYITLNDITLFFYHITVWRITKYLSKYMLCITI